MVRSDGLNESIARAMETEVRLLPVLPDLLVDLWELGASPEEIVSVLQSLEVDPRSRVLDLGCGKGAVGVALAEQLGLRVEGIDAFPPFLQSANTLAEEHGVGSRCRFRQGDIRAFLGQRERYDAVLLLSVGPVSGDYEQTIAGLRTLVRPGGYIVIEDGFLADGVEPSPETEGYAGRAETLRRLTACGDRLVEEIVCEADETRSVNERNTDQIRRRARIVKKSHPRTGRVDRWVCGETGARDSTPRNRRNLRRLGPETRLARQRETASPVLHIALHLAVPVLVALAFYRPHWKQVALLLVATMVVDVDHLLADPIYDAARCSIGFHPLHTAPAIVCYAALLALPLAFRKEAKPGHHRPAITAVHLIGLGLMIHMALDWADCLI